MQEYVKASDELRSSRAWWIRNRLEELDLTFRMLAKNYAELKSWTKKQAVASEQR
ncbi:MAG: hypothetical protein Q8Q00_11395 [Dehalococcoidia bacterium]|nr:hypothetical protein [Dehalococcoidia bacterium]